MDKSYKVYKLKYGINKYEINGPNVLSLHKNEVMLALAEAILQDKGFHKIGEVQDKQLMVIENDQESGDEE